MLKYTILFAVIAGLVLALAPAAQAAIIQTVPVGNPGNLADTETSYGAVADVYYIGKYEVTNEQYCEFLNSVADADPNALYNESMGSEARGGITRTAGFTYTVKQNMGNKPVNYVSWYDTLRFANWLHNGQPTGAQGDSTTEDGAYDMDGAQTRKAGATWWLPSEDEWYKAAYHKNDGVTGNYWDYPTGVDTPDPTAVLANPTGDGVDPDDGTTTPAVGNHANFNDGAVWNSQTGNVTTVGTNGDPSPYATYDQGGNIWEWNEDQYAYLDLDPALFRGIRGGSYRNVVSSMSAPYRDTFGGPADERIWTGFRVSAIPEPATLAMLLLGLPFVMRRKRR